MEDNGTKPEDARAAVGRSTGRNRSSRRRRAVSLAGLVAAAALGLAACGGPGTSGTGAGGTGGPDTGTTGRSAASDAKLLEFARCMRAHGLPGFPDPVAGPDGYGFRIAISPGSPLNPHSAQFQAANSACKAFSPYEGLTPAQQVVANAKALRYSGCMRSHGISAYPDPNGQGTINVAAGPGIAPASPRFQQAEHACQSLDSGFNMSTSNFPS